MFISQRASLLRPSHSGLGLQQAHFEGHEYSVNSTALMEGVVAVVSLLIKLNAESVYQLGFSRGSSADF